MFDMMIGTSIGGIIVLCLALGIDINDMNNIFLDIAN